MTGTLRIGDLAKATGLTVRTLRHYEGVGLLEPVERSASGYRQYRTEDAERLYAIVALRRLGLSLAQIRSTLAAEPAGGLPEALSRHLAVVRERIESLRELESVLDRVQRELGRARPPSLVELCELVRLTVRTPPRHLAEEPGALGVLAEPLSGRILDRLQRRGPATDRALARSLDETSETVSGQLDRLGEHGFVEEDRVRSRRGARVWRIVESDLRLPQVERTEESDRVARSWFEPSLGALARFVEREDAWAGSAALSTAALSLTRDELERLRGEYIALVRRYGRPVEEAPEGARPATALFFAFPTEDAG